MSVESFKVWLSARPATVSSAPDCARSHAIDPKTASRLLTQAGYVKASHGASWSYDVVLDSTPIDPYNMHLVGISPTTAAYVVDKLNDIGDEHEIAAWFTTTTDTKSVYRMLVCCMAYLQVNGALPIRSEATYKGFKPLSKPESV